jgi:DNA-binding response OmpR family regulator
MRLLVVEDEPALRGQLQSALRDAGYAIDTASDGEEALHLGKANPYDLVVLDLGLPKRDGVEVLRAWRAAERRFPVLILTARGRWQDKVEGLDAGADDYLVKPFQMEELLARTKALLRRAAGLAQPVIRCGPIALDTARQSVTLDGAALELTGYEYRLVEYLILHAGQTTGSRPSKRCAGVATALPSNAPRDKSLPACAPVARCEHRARAVSWRDWLGT